MTIEVWATTTNDKVYIAVSTADGYYNTIHEFISIEEVDKFIEELKTLATKIWDGS